MKTLTYLAIFFGLLFTFNACTKTGYVTEHLDATHATVKIGQTDSLELVGASATDSIAWTVTPSGSNWMIGSHNHAIVNFNKAGNYTVMASVMGAASYTYLITVTNEVYNPTPPPANGAAVHISIAGDQITLHSHYSPSSKSDSAYVYFTAQTTNTYQCSNSLLNYTHSLDASGHFGINFIDMYKPATINCQTGNTTITSPAIPFLQTIQNTYLASGTYPLTVGLNGVTYTGSVTITATDINFNWVYTSGVTIAPLHITR
ncbi:hypothetical protein ACFGVR_14675 [Mucilaginibacter sp. AW1-3]